MNELDLFRDFCRGAAAPSAEAQRRASARLASALDDDDGREGTPRVRHRGRRRVVTLVAAALVVVVGTASAIGSVREFILDRGFIGLPPEGATPSAPESGELVLQWEGRSATLDGAPLARVWVYADGRIIWSQTASRSGRIPEGATELTSGYLEQRLTPSGVELLQSEVVGLLDRSRALLETIPADDDPLPGPFGGLALFVPGDNGLSGVRWGSLKARDGDRLVRLQWRGIPAEGSQGYQETLDDLRKRFEGTIATPKQVSDLRRIDALLTDPASVLPTSAWAIREIRAYVPSHYAVCIDTSPPKDESDLLSLLPTRAADVLGDKSPTRLEGDVVASPEGGGPVAVQGRYVTYCSKLATEEAREVAKGFSGLDPDAVQGRVRLAYRLAEGVHWWETTTIWFEPYFPHGQVTCSACG